MGFAGSNSVIEAPTPTATSAAYAKALEEANPQRKDHSRSPRRIQGETNESQFEDERDQPIQNVGERLAVETRDTYKSTTAKIIHTIPVSRVVTPKQILFNQDNEAKKLLQSILNLDTEVTEAAAAVYHYFETKMVDDEVSPSDRAIEVIHSIKHELRKGNSRPAYQFLETAKSVLPILLEEREEAGMEMEANIFSNDTEESVLHEQMSAPIPEDAHSEHDMRSISDQTAAIFQLLGDDAYSIGMSEIGRRSAYPAGTAGTSDENIIQILEEEEEEVPEFTPDGIYLPYSRKEFSGNIGHNPDSEDPSNFNAPNVDDMDLEFVEHFDLAYSEFLFYHPKLVSTNPELLKNLRVYKLQKLLEYNEVLERANAEKLNSLIEEKKAVEESMQMKLKDAVRKKAARQTFLHSVVNDINWNTKQIQAKLRWKLLKYSEDRAKRQSRLREQFKQIPKAKTREELVRLIPEGPHSKKLETAIKASFIAEGSPEAEVLSPKQDDQLRKFQVENSILNSELSILNQKVAHLRNETKKLEWVQPTLMQLNKVTMQKFKKKFEKKEGVTL